MDKTVELFNTHFQEYDNWYEENKFAYLSEIQTIKQFLSLNAKSLEIGVGTGRFATALDVDCGIDPSFQMLKFAKKRKICVTQAKGEILPFKNGVFESVLIVVTLCFAQDASKIISEASRVVKKGGNIIIGIIDKNSELANYYIEKKSSFYKYANFLSTEEVTNMVKEKDFDNFSYSQTLFDFPKYNKMNSPKEGYGEGAFVIIKANK